EAAASELKGLGTLPPEDAERAGLVYLDLFQPEAAIPLFRQATRARQGPPTAALHLGFALLLAGHDPDAVPPRATAQHAQPGEPILSFYLGSALRQAGDPAHLADAEVYLRNAAESVPSDPVYQYELAVCRVQQRDRGGALAAMERASAVANGLPEVERDLGR